ncbi:MAG: hypothetical protein R2791_12810 [Saprospiraceae bacterium]
MNIPQHFSLRTGQKYGRRHPGRLYWPIAFQCSVNRGFSKYHFKKINFCQFGKWLIFNRLFFVFENKFWKKGQTPLSDRLKVQPEKLPFACPKFDETGALMHAGALL